MIQSFLSYSVIRELGRGAKGVVYLVEKNGERYALKTLLREGAEGDLDSLVRFRQESFALSRLSHPGIVGVHEVGEHEGNPFIVMEFLTAEDLKTRLTRGALPLDLALHVTKQVASALGEVHRLKMVHRDLKPENVIFTANDVIKLIDFGMVGEVGQPMEAVVGTLMYASPEQAGLVEGVIDESSDLYSLGVMLFEMLIGTPPFAEDALMQQKAEGRADNVHVRNPALPPVLGEIILKLLNKDPARRYRSAKGLIADLNALEELNSHQRAGATYKLGAFDRTISLKDAPLAGRTSELERLLKIWRDARAGHGGIALIEGDPGTGKTRIAGEVMREALAKNALAYSSKCSRVDTIALAPVLDLIKIHINQIQVLPASERDKFLAYHRTLPAATFAVLLSVSAELPRVFGVPAPAHAELSQETYLQSLIQIFAHIARYKNGLLVVIENAHWLDESSFELLKRLSREIGQLPIALLLTTRPGDENMAALAEYVEAGKSSSLETVSLEVLKPADAQLMISGLLGGARVDDKVAGLIAGPAGYNPFAIREYLQAIVDGGALTLADGILEIDEANLGKIPLSLDAAELIEKRLRELNKEDVSVLAWAAVLGSPFESRNLSHLAATDARRAILAAEKAGLVEWTGENTLAFTHDQVRECALATLSGDDLARMHAAAAARLQEIHERTPQQVHALATHYMFAGELAPKAQALKALHEAARLALDAYANKQAHGILSYAYQQIATSGPLDEVAFACAELYAKACVNVSLFADALTVIERLSAQVTDPLTRANLQYWQIRAELGAGNLDKSWSTFLSALRTLGVHYPTKSVTNLIQLIWFLFRWWFQGRFAFGYNRYPAGDTRHAQKRARVQLLCRLLEQGANNAFLRSKPMDYLQITARSSTLAYQLGPSRELALAISTASAAISNLGFDKVVDRYFEFSLGIAKQMDDVGLEIYINYHLLLSYMFRGHLDRYDELFARNFPQSVRYLPAWQLGTQITAHTSLMAQRGHMVEIVEFYSKTLYLIDETKNLGLMSDFRMTYSARLEFLGRHEEAEKRLRESQVFYDQIKSSNSLSRAISIVIKVFAASESSRPFVTDQEERIQDWVAKTDRSFFFFGAYLFIAMLRISQCDFSSSEAERVRYLEELRKVAAKVKKLARTPLYESMREIVLGGLSRLQGKYEAAERHYGEAERLAVLADSRTAIYWAFTERARLARARGQLGRAQIEARAALDLAVEHQWAIRKERVEFEFADLLPSTAPVSQNLPVNASGSGLSMERAMTALLEISAAASKHIDPVAQGRSTLDTVVRLLGAERACIFLGRDSASLTFFLGRTANGEDIAEMKGFSTTVVRKVYEERKAMIITGTDQGEAIGSKSIVAHNLKSIMVVPLVLQEDIMGVIYLDSSLTKGLFSDADLDLFVAISTQIAASIHISELAVVESERQVMKKDLELSASVQKMFLPQKVEMQSSGMALAGFYRPAAQCGGDWWWYRADADRLAVVVGDVTGHGAGPAMITASIASSFKMLEDKASGVRELIQGAHGQLFDIAKTEYAMTMFGCEVNGKTRQVKYWSACAPNAMVFNRGHDEMIYLDVKGGLLGLDDFFIDDGEYAGQQGDRIFIYSDGIVEMKMADGRQLGERRLGKILSKYREQDAETAKVKLVEELDQLRGAEPQDDDFTFVIIDLV